MKWRDFKTDPPYDAKKDEEEGYETDRTYAWFVFRYKHRNPRWIGLSHRASEFFDGIFTDYKSHMRTSPYPEDHIEVIAWLDESEVRDFLMKDFELWGSSK